MNRLSRILGGPSWLVIIGVVICLNHVMLGVLAWSGDKVPLVMLVVFSMVWVLLLIETSMARTSNLRAWERSMERESEVHKLSADYAHLLGEACSALHTWDSDQADDIIHRAQTIGRLRQKNYDERNAQ